MGRSGLLSLVKNMVTEEAANRESAAGLWCQSSLKHLFSERETFRLARVLCAAMVAVSCFVMGCGSNQEFPSRPLTLICPWSAGGGTDRIARQVAVQLEEELGVPVNVVNATGGGGVTGHSRGALASPDGYTLTLATVELNMLHHRGLSAIGPDDYQPLGLLNRDPAALFVHKRSDWQSLADVEAALAERAEPMNASGTAAGGIWHAALIGWVAQCGLPSESVNWISINGAAPSLQELMAGGIDLVCCSIPEARAMLDAGEIRCLGLMADERSPAAPDVPTFREQGDDWSLSSWRGLLCPRGVPPERVEVLEAAVDRLSRSPKFAEFMDSGGFQTSIADASEFTEFLSRSDRQFAETLGSPAFVQSQTAVVRPYFFPICLGILGLIFVVPACRSQAAVATEPSAESDVRSWSRWLRPVVVILAVIAFVAACETIGYVLATAALMWLLAIVFGATRRQTVGVTLLAAPLLYQLFARTLGVPLPWGWLGW